MRNKRIDKTRIYKCAAIVLALIFLMSAGLFGLKMWERWQGRFPEIDVPDTFLTYNGAEYELNGNLETFLVLGLDKFDGEGSADSYNNDKQADFLMLFVFDNDKKTCSMLQIDRDTMAEINILGVAGDKVGTTNQQIALAHTYGNGKEVSCRNTSDAVSKLLGGMKINHYISVTMDGVSIFNDLLGGVEVTVLDDFSSVDSTLVKGEKITLKGQQALNYVRSRQGLDDSTNQNRMKRQQQYINALYAKVLDVMTENEEFAVDATVKMSEYIVADRTVNQLEELARKITEYQLVKVDNIKGESKVVNQLMEFHPEKDSVQKTVVKLFYKLKD